MRILVVDDCQDTARMMKVLLKGGGHEVKVAFDGTEAVQVAMNFLPEVVLLDLTLPDMSGLEVAEELRKAKGVEETSIVAVTGYGAEKLPPIFDGHFTKPVNHDALDCYLAKLASADRKAQVNLPRSYPLLSND